MQELENIPNSKDHGANMGPIWGQQDPNVPHFGPMNFAIWEGRVPGCLIQYKDDILPALQIQLWR